MHEDSASVLGNHSLFGPQERGVASTQQFYRDEIQTMIGALYTQLPTYEKQLGGHTCTLVRDNLRVLESCFYSSALNVEAVEVIHEHLLTLSRMLARKSN